ncbi:MAG: aromatic ring-hydroxylating oxygenase subunit alpha [Actinomycetota bacterium]
MTIAERDVQLNADPAWTADPGPDHIDREIYTKRAIFEAEQDRIFARVWQLAATATELSRPGDFVSVDVGPDPVIVVRDKQGSLNAFYNTCTHRGAELKCEPRGNCGAMLRCPYHNWSFDLSGSLAAIPYPEAYGDDFPKEQLGLVPARVEQCGSFVFVATKPRIPTLRDFLGEAWEWVERLTEGREVIGRAAWIYEGNWKLWHENFRDNYHPEFVHRFVRDIEHGYADPGNGGTNRSLEPGHSMLEWTMISDFERYTRGLERASGIVVNPAMNEEWAGGAGGGEDGGPAGPPPVINIAAIFPNVDLQHLQISGEPGSTTVQVVKPLDVDRTRIDITFMSVTGEPAELRQFKLDHDADTQGSWGKVSADDTEIMAITQLGLRGRGTKRSNMGRGRSPGRVGETRDEYSIRSLYRTWRDYMYEQDA